jgi:hypothetical protein
LEVLERITISNTTFGPLIDIHKRWIGGHPRIPLLHELLEVELLLSGGELPRTVMNRLEGNGIGIGSTRHSVGGEER